MSPVRVIFQMTLREAARRRILSLSLAVGMAMLLIYGIACTIAADNMQEAGLLRQQVFRFLYTFGMYPVNMLMVMMAVFTSADTLAGEIRSGVIQTIASKPLRRAQIVWGKWCAYAVLIGTYLLIIGGGVTGVVYTLSGFFPRRWAAAFGSLWLEGLLLLSVTMWASARLSTLASGVVGIGLHGVAFLGGWIEQIGRVAGSPSAEQIGVLTSLIFPSEALWRRAAYEMQRPILAGLGEGPFSGKVVPSDWMVLYAALYTALALTLAIRTFSRRDL